MRRTNPRGHLVVLADLQYDPVQYQNLIQVDNSTGCWVVPDCHKVKMSVWHTESASWRVTHPLRIAARLKMGEGPGKRKMRHSCGNINCVNLDHVSWDVPKIPKYPSQQRTVVRSSANPQITRDQINPNLIAEKQEQFDEFTSWWREHKDPNFTMPQWIEIEESYKIIIRTKICGSEQSDQT